MEAKQTAKQAVGGTAASKQAVSAVAASSRCNTLLN
jgi:hypothetical protein